MKIRLPSILILLAIISLEIGGFIFLYHTAPVQEKSTIAKVLQVPSPTPSQEIDPSSLSWTQTKTALQGWPKRDSHSVFVFQNKMWVLGGLDSDNSKIDGVPDYEQSIYYNDIWNTSDGTNWTRVVEHADFPYIRSASVVPFKGSLYMYGGWSPQDGLRYANGIWRSTDGINWQKVVEKPEYTEREGQIVLEWNGKLWLVGGVDYFGRKTFNDVWSSDDGIHWAAATTDAPWHSRWDHALGIINGKMYIAGGMNFRGVGYSDEWSSSDGAHWDLVSANAAWGERQGQEIVNYGGYAWLISGLHSASNEGKGDAWYSKDGISWKKAPDDYQWLGREDHGVIVFNDKIWVMGGMNSNWNWEGDVWHSNFTTSTQAQTGAQASTSAATPTPTPQATPTPLPTIAPTATPAAPATQTPQAGISALEYLSVFIDTDGKQTILAERNKNVPLPIASVTKLMTALVASEQLDLDANITVPGDAMAGKGSAGVIMGGEIFSGHDLLHSLLLPSDNDSAETFAAAIGRDKFVAFMNATAQELGMTDTHYGTPTGLDYPGPVNHATAEDLVTLATDMLKNHPEILAVTREKTATIYDTLGVAHVLTNTDQLLSAQLPFEVVGGKTGETPAALKNLVLITKAPNDAGYIISVIIHSEDNFGDMKMLLLKDMSVRSWN